MRSRSLLRSGALLAAGMLGVHQLRYALAFGGASSHELARQGHGYLLAVEPAVIAVLALAAGQLLRSIAGAGPSSGVTAPAATLRRRWLAAAVLLLTVYAAQEWVEGLIAAGHPGGLAGVFGHGGWLAAPLAAAIGLLIALLERGAELVAAGPAARVAAVARAHPRYSHPTSFIATIGDPVARHLAGRGPPATSAR